jgi:GPH family glycoside/pentoside/hexuronide:cation symporter
VPFIICNFGVGTGYSFLSILTWAIVADVIDYQEMKTGIKNESAIYAVYTFARKVGQTVADSGGLQLLYRYAGYDPETKLTGYIPGVGEKIYKMVSRVMFIAYGITFILFLFYPLNKKKLAAMQDELAVIRKQRMEEMPAVDPADAEI